MFIDASINAGFLSGKESDEMIDAHVAAGMVGEPFYKENNVIDGNSFQFGRTEGLTSRYEPFTHNWSGPTSAPAKRNLCFAPQTIWGIFGVH